MMVHLAISNFAIIKDLDLTLRQGLNILSGETGAGKSIIINAMNLLLGGRASADLIRSGCEEARVEALFHFPGNRLLEELLSELGIAFEGELLIKRTILREGRNKIFINGSMATLQMLARLGSALISVSGQHEHQFLLKPENHLYILDDFAGLSEERIEVKGVYDRYQEIMAEIAGTEKEIRERAEKEELNRFQIQEIESAQLTPGEEDSLKEERTRLRHAEELLAIAGEGYQSLYESEESVLSMVSKHLRQLEKGAGIDERLGDIRDTLADVEVKLEDAALSLRDFQKSVEMDPRRLEEIEERLETINRLKRKYGSSIEEVLKYRENLASVMDGLEDRKERLEKLENEKQEIETDLLKRANALSTKRKQAARVLDDAVEKELMHLNMKGTSFRAQVESVQDPGDEAEERSGIDGIGAIGFDRVEFLICPNVGEELRPLSKIASGGELSRIILALKTILARTSSVETVVFDEVDSGIGGATAEVVGEKILNLAGYHQILCITHLPQIASKGETHFLVKKEVAEGRTQARIMELDPEARVNEVARLLGGREITERAVAHAREMLGG